jgi:hypothetical protein
MLSEEMEVFTKDNLDRYLSELSKEYKKLGGRNTPVEIILIGGAAVIESYGFRDMTTDIDAILPAASIMKDAIQRVAVRNGLPEDWLNADFIMTDSYSSRLNSHSVFYKTFNQVLYVRMITGEYLIAMKLRAGRQYKNDLSDVVGILNEHEKKGAPISFEMIDKAVKALYGGWERFPQRSLAFIQKALSKKNYELLYQQTRSSEQQAKKILLSFEEDHGMVQEEKIDSILEADTNKDSKPSLLKRLNEYKKQQATKNGSALKREHNSREEP